MVKAKNNGQVKSSLAKRNIQKFAKNRMAVVGLIGLVIIIFMCVFAPLFTEYDPTLIDPAIRSQPPSDAHILGTDRLGRDIFARILYGGRYSIAIGVVAALAVNLVGCIFGCVSGFFGGKVDSILVSIQEFFSIFPSILLMILAVSIIGPGVQVMIGVWVLTGWGGTMRMVRGKIMSLKQEPFVESCRANGVSNWSIMFRHMLPNTLGPIIVNIAGGVAGYMISEAGLSYLGLGVPESIPTWGNIINAAKRLDIIQTEPMLWVAPGVAMCLFLLCVNFFGNGLRDALDPTAK